MCNNNNNNNNNPFPVVQSGAAKYDAANIEASYLYETVLVESSQNNSSSSSSASSDDGSNAITAQVTQQKLRFRTGKIVPKVGVMLVGLGGNNGSTVVGGIIANRRTLTWRTKTGMRSSNWFGSLMLAGTLKLGTDKFGNDIYVPLKSMLPIVDPTSLAIGGWDISNMNLGDAVRRSAVFDLEVQDQLYDEMQNISPLPAIYVPHFIHILFWIIVFYESFVFSKCK